MSRKRRRTGTAGQANTTERTAVTETVDASVEPEQEQEQEQEQRSEMEQTM